MRTRGSRDAGSGKSDRGIFTRRLTSRGSSSMGSTAVADPSTLPKFPGAGSPESPMAAPSTSTVSSMPTASACAARENPSTDFMRPRHSFVSKMRREDPAREVSHRFVASGIDLARAWRPASKRGARCCDAISSDRSDLKGGRQSTEEVHWHVHGTATYALSLPSL